MIISTELIDLLSPIDKNNHSAEKYDAEKPYEKIGFRSVSDVLMWIDARSESWQFSYGDELSQVFLKNNSTIIGNPNEFHALITALIDIPQYPQYALAYIVCDAALRKWQDSHELLLADKIYLCGYLYDFDAGSRCLENIGEKILYPWTSYLFDCVLFYYRMKIAIRPKDTSLVEETYDLAKRMQQVYPNDEKGFYHEAQLLIQEKKYDKAINNLSYWILRMHPDPTDPDDRLKCPHCCKLWIEQTKLRSEYELTKVIAKLGLKWAYELENDRLQKWFQDYEERQCQTNAEWHMKGSKPQDSDPVITISIDKAQNTELNFKVKIKTHPEEKGELNDG